MTQFRTVPTYEQPLALEKNTAASWYRFFQDIQNGRAPGPEMAVVPTGSPYVYHAFGGGFLIVRGAGVTKIEFSRDQINFYDTGTTQGIFPLSNADSYRITYGAAPTVIFVPQ